jgi:hypothetical protein
MSEAPHIVPLDGGRFALRLSREERRILGDLPGQLRELLAAGDPSVERLFPPAYPDDPDHEEEYRRMVGEQLLEGRRAALEVVEATLNSRTLDEDQLRAWLGVLNDLRLVLGTRLEVTEDDDEPDDLENDPRGPELALYHYLGWLVAQAVDALGAADLP